MSVTIKRRLRSGATIWSATRASAAPTRPLKRDASTDVLIVGAGVSGALIADALTDAGLSVIIVDRREPITGSTAASTALIQYEIDMPLIRLASRIGRTRAERIWRRSRLAVDALRERARELRIEADMTDRDSLYLEGDQLNEAQIAEEAQARLNAGFNVTFLDRRAVKARFGIARRAALLGYANVAANPRKLTAGFLNAAMARGARLYAPCEVADIEAGRSGVVARTKDGPAIAAKSLIFATGYELPKGVPRHGHRIASTWAIATKPQPRRLWPERCMIWEASDPYLYLRVGPDERVICGGEDEDFVDEDARDAMIAEKTTRIEQKLRRLFPHIDPTADYAWCGSFGVSKTGTPTIGRVPRMPNCYAALGYGGNGITFSMIAAQVLRATLTGQFDQDAALFSFGRRF